MFARDYGSVANVFEIYYGDDSCESFSCDSEAGNGKQIKNFISNKCYRAI
jgi:hypothetical protein